MKLDKDTLVVIGLTFVVVVGFTLLNIYLAYFPLHEIRISGLHLKNIETTIDQATINKIDISKY